MMLIRCHCMSWTRLITIEFWRKQFEKMKDLCLFKDSGQIKLTMLIRGRLISLDCVSSTAATGQDVKAIIPITPFSDKLDTVKTKRINWSLFNCWQLTMYISIQWHEKLNNFTFACMRYNRFFNKFEIRRKKIEKQTNCIFAKIARCENTVTFLQILWTGKLSWFHSIYVLFFVKTWTIPKNALCQIELKLTQVILEKKILF